MRRFSKELLALFGGLAFAYVFQLFMLLMVYIENPESHLLTARAFVPQPLIMLALSPLVSWGFMGCLRVRWLRVWFKITCCGIAALFPFAVIAMLAIYVNARLWHTPVFWVVNLAVSIGIAYTSLKPSFKKGK